MRESEVTERRLGAGPLRRRLPTSPRLADALAELAGAAHPDEVAAVAVEHARSLTGARGSALALISPGRADVVLACSTGYDCDAMAPGVRIPMDAGLPMTEAARTGTPVVRLVPDGGWVAVPLAADPANPVGSLLVSLDASSEEPDVDLLSSLATHVRRALHRARPRPQAVTNAQPESEPEALPESAPEAPRVTAPDSAVDPRGQDPAGGAQRPAARIPWLAESPVTLPGTRPRPPATTALTDAPTVRWRLRGMDVAARNEPLRDRPEAEPDGHRRPSGGGDGVEVVADGADGVWVVVLDACGNDREAHRAARTASLLVRAMARHVREPDTLLDELDRLLESEGASRYVTALAMHVRPGGPGAGARVRMASAGHPLPLLIGAEPVGQVGAELTGLPLNLGLGVAVGARTIERTLPPGATLLGFTDGLSERRGQSLPEDVMLALCARATTLFPEVGTALETLLDVLTTAEGAPTDDTAAVLLRVR